MSKTNDTSRPAALENHRPLADSKLHGVTGGMLYLARGSTAPQSSESLTQMLQKILQTLGKQ